MLKFWPSILNQSHCPDYEQKQLKNSGSIFSNLFVHILGNATTSYLHSEISWPFNSTKLICASEVTLICLLVELEMSVSMKCTVSFCNQLFFQQDFLSLIKYSTCRIYFQLIESSICKYPTCGACLKLVSVTNLSQFT